MKLQRRHRMSEETKDVKSEPAATTATPATPVTPVTDPPGDDQSGETKMTLEEALIALEREKKSAIKARKSAAKYRTRLKAVVTDEPPEEGEGDPNSKVFSELQSIKARLKKSEIARIAKEKDVDPETLEGLIAIKKIDLLEEDSSDLLDELIQTKGLSRKKAQDFGTPASNAGSGVPTTKYKSIDEFLAAKAPGH